MTYETDRNQPIAASAAGYDAHSTPEKAGRDGSYEPVRIPKALGAAFTREPPDGDFWHYLCWVCLRTFGAFASERDAVEFGELHHASECVVGRAAGILEATLRDIDADKGDVSAESWGALLGVLGLLRGDHGMASNAHDLKFCVLCLSGEHKGPLCGVSGADVRDYLQPCDRAHVVPDGQDCDEHGADVAAEVASYGNSGWVAIDNRGDRPWEAGFDVGAPRAEWSAMLWDTVSWRTVGTVGDRQHAESEAADWLSEGMRPGERIALASRDVGAWRLADYGQEASP